MSPKRFDEIDSEKCKRFRLIYEQSGLSQAKFAELICEKIGFQIIRQQDVSRISKRERKLKDDIARAVIEAFPQYRIEWLLALDDYPTAESKTVAEFNGLADSAFASTICLAREGGYSVELAKPFNESQIRNGVLPFPVAIKGVHAGYVFGKDGKTATVSLVELRAIENEIQSFFNYKIDGLMN